MIVYVNKNGGMNSHSLLLQKFTLTVSENSTLPSGKQVTKLITI